MSYTLDAQPAVRNISCVRGDSLDVTFPMVDAVGAPADLSGFIGKAVAVGNAGGVRTHFVVNVSTTSVRLRLTTGQTGAMERVNRFDLRLFSGSDVVTVLKGHLEVLPATTDL